MRVVLSNANVIDCVHPRPLAGASVTVEHGRIVEVLESSRSPDYAPGTGDRPARGLSPARAVGRAYPSRLLHRSPIRPPSSRRCSLATASWKP